MAANLIKQMGGMAPGLLPPTAAQISLPGGASEAPQQRLLEIAEDPSMHPEARQMAAGFTDHMEVAGSGFSSGPLQALNPNPNPNSNPNPQP